MTSGHLAQTSIGTNELLLVNLFGVTARGTTWGQLTWDITSQTSTAYHVSNDTIKLAYTSYPDTCSTTCSASVNPVPKVSLHLTLLGNLPDTADSLILFVYHKVNIS